MSRPLIIYFENECMKCGEIFENENCMEYCIGCLPTLPSVKDRVKGEKYLHKKEIVIWDGKGLRCEHNREGSKCKECGGASICKHNRERSKCKDCGGGSICEHNRQRSACKDCGGASVCKHNRRRSTCKDCGGASVCEHDRQRRECIDCFVCPQNFCEICKSVYVRNSPYNPKCYRCYCYTNPDKIIPRRYKMKENYVNEYIKEKLSEYNPIHDKIVSGGCSLKKPDWLFDLYTHSVIGENDKDSHSSYSCESKRTMTIFQDLGSRPMVMIRFNCDQYTDKKGEKIQGCFTFDEKNVISPTLEWYRRRDKFIERLEYWCENIPNKEITQEDLFYNEYD